MSVPVPSRAACVILSRDGSDRPQELIHHLGLVPALLWGSSADSEGVLAKQIHVQRAVSCPGSHDRGRMRTGSSWEASSSAGRQVPGLQDCHHGQFDLREARLAHRPAGES